MASAQLQQPESFNFRNPDDWAKWKRQFEQFRSASGLAAEDEPRQVNTLLYCMGEEAEDALTSTGISAEERQTYAGVVARFDEFFKVRRNTMHSRESEVQPS